MEESPALYLSAYTTVSERDTRPASAFPLLSQSDIVKVGGFGAELAKENGTGSKSDKL